ncbi:hypothetical protein CP973_00925 [Streptomyces albofaciens JCM 4342]|nr:hypothetical protein CP973_00925 [Streptomyces albofaciens JCM 4342]
MGAEARGEEDEARRLFLQAWDEATDDYEACIAAHYVARHQTTPQDTLRWNRECLDRADRVGDERVRGFYASLYANMGRAHRELGEMTAAHAYFVRAAERVRDIPEGEYGVWNRFAIAEGLRETAAPSVVGDTPECREGTEPVRASPTELLSGLVTKLCERNELKALGLILPAFLGDLGTEEDRVRLRSALHMVHAARWLPAVEQAALEAAITALAETEADRASVAG